MTSREEMKELLVSAFKAGIAAAHPEQLFDREGICETLKELAVEVKGKVVIVGAGKASAAMACAFEREWDAAGGVVSDGFVVTREDYECKTQWTEIALAGHPYADDRSIDATARLLQLAQSLSADDLLVSLWSGGASSLLSAPIHGVDPASLQHLSRALVNAGADIFEINTVRRHLLAASGGRLAMAAAPAQLLNIVLPDVVDPDNDELWLATIASGPTMPDPTTLQDAAQVLKTWEILPPPDIAAALDDAKNETPKTWEEIRVTAQTTIVLPGNAAIEGAAAYLEAHWDGDIHMITPDPAGDATEIGVEFGQGFQQASFGRGVYLCAGELTVQASGDGAGGPNQEFALAMALTLDGAVNIYALSGDTDGIDGKGTHAGAFIAPDTLAHFAKEGIDAGEALMRNNTAPAFAAIGDAVITGPTFTNVNDLRLVVING